MVYNLAAVFMKKMRSLFKKKQIYGEVLPKNYCNIKSVLTSFNMAEGAISHSITLSQLLLNGHITPTDFEKADSLTSIKKIDWNKNGEPFMEQAHVLPLAVVAFWMIACSESYFDLSEGKVVDPEKNPDLHSAQMILKIIRNSFGHPRLEKGQMKIKWNLREKIYRNRFEIKDIGLILDTRSLNKQDFKLADLGGWDKFFKLLEYLKRDLTNRL